MRRALCRVKRTPRTPQRARERANAPSAAAEAAGRDVGPFSAASYEVRQGSDRLLKKVQMQGGTRCAE